MMRREGGTGRTARRPALGGTVPGGRGRSLRGRLPGMAGDGEGRESGTARTGAASSPSQLVAPPAVSGDKPGRRLARVPAAEVETRPDGRLFVRDPSPLRDMKPAQRLRRVLGMLEAAAMLGDVSAARELVSHARWVYEVRHGKPAQAVAVTHGGTVRVVDSLGRPVAGAAVVVEAVDPAEVGAPGASPTPESAPGAAAPGSSSAAARRTRRSAAEAWRSA